MTELIYYPHANQCLNQIVDNAYSSNDDKAAFTDRINNSNRCILSADSPIPQRQPIIIPGKNRDHSAYTLLPLATCTPDQHDVLRTLNYAIGGAGVLGCWGDESGSTHVGHQAARIYWQLKHLWWRWDWCCWAGFQFYYKRRR